MSDQPQALPRSTILGLRDWVVAALALLTIVVFLLLPSPFPLGKLDTVAYAVCHRIPERSFFLGGHQLPLCARCSGTFLGVLLSLVTLTVGGRLRAGRLPPPRVLLVLVSFVIFWIFDGLNSYLTLLLGAPLLYQPQNWLRLVTGMLNGLALGSLIFSLFNFSLWQTPRPQAVLENLKELAGLVFVAGLLIGLILTGADLLLYPIALTSTLGVIAMLTGVNTILVLVLFGRENQAHRWQDTIWPLLTALALSLVIVMGVGAGRTALTETLGLPF